MGSGILNISIDVQLGHISITGPIDEIIAKIKSRLRKSRSDLNKVRTLGEKLVQVQWTGIVDTTGLKANWHDLWLVWFFETAPNDLGVWSNHDTHVTITRPDYIDDIKSRPHYKKCIAEFKKQYPNLNKIKANDVLKEPLTKTPGYLFRFTGQGTATGKYNAVEWFLGSYRTNMKVQSVNVKLKQVSVVVSVSNLSHWESATRVPAVGQNAGLPKYLMKNAPRSELGPGGNFEQEFVWKETIQY